MASKEATLILKLKDLATSGLKKAESGFSALKAQLLAVTAAAAGFTAFLVSSIKAYTEQENAVNKLNVALRNQGIFTEAVSKDLQGYASALQQTTTFSDEAILETQALLVTFGLAGEELKRTTQATLDLSTGLGVDLHAAALLLGKAFAGETGTLARYGITIDQSIPRAERFEAVLDQLNQRFGGGAQAQLDTTAGKLANFSLRVGELKERIGGLLIPTINFFVDALSTGLEVIERITNSTAGFSRFVATLGQVLIEFGEEIFQAFIYPFEILSPLLEKVGIDVDGLRERMSFFFDEQQARLEQWAMNAEMSADRQIQADSRNIQSKRQASAMAQQIILQQQKEEEKALLARQALLADLDKKEREMRLKLLEDKEKWRKDEEARQLQTLQNQITVTQVMLGQLRDIFAGHTKIAFAIDKANAIASAIINTAVGATKALALGPIAGPIAAATIKALGAVQIAAIGAQTVRGLAEGGVVLPRQGGTLATIGEAGSAEAVIPLDDERAQDMLGGMGGVTININAGTIIADNMSVREFAERLNEEFFRLRRNGQDVFLG